MVNVFDTSAILNNFGPIETTAYITNSVISEIKDFEFRNKLNNAISTGKLKIQDPTEENIKKVKEVQKQNKLKLSQTDVEVIALALEKKATLHSDDYNLLHACRILKIKTEKIIR